VTARDWADFWIHEGICSYAEALFLNDKFGIEAYHKYVKENLRRRIQNRQPIVPQRDATTSESYNGDIYAKAATMLHTLRYLIGDSLLLNVLKTFARIRLTPCTTASSHRISSILQIVKAGRI